MAEPQLLNLLDSSSTAEHPVTVTKSIKRHSWSHLIGEVTLTTEHSLHLNISTQSNEALSIPLTLSFHPYHGIIPPNKPGPPNWTIDITTSIRTSTIFATHQPTTLPISTTATEDFHSRFYSVTTAPETKEFVEPEWRTWRDCQCVDDERSAVRDTGRGSPCWTTVLQVPVTTPRSLQAGYSSVFMKRKYVLVVRVRVKNYIHEVMEVEIPLQVVDCEVGVGGEEDVGVGEVMDEVDENVGVGNGGEIYFAETWLATSTVI